MKLMISLDLTSSLTEAIGRTLMHSIWTGFLILSLMKLILHLIPDRHAELRYRLAGLSLLLHTGTVVFLFILLYQPADTAAMVGMSIPDTWIRAVEPGGSASGQPFIRFQVWNLISYLYFAGFFWMFMRNSLSFYHLKQLKKSGYSTGPGWSGKLEELVRRMGIRRRVEFIESSKVSSPGLYGWFRPVVIIPAGMLAQMPFDQVETVMMHELYHLRRFDDLVNLLQVVVEGIFFYHPAVWMISGTMRTEREHCCDDLVLRAGHPPLLYAKALTGLSDNRYYQSRMAVAAGGTGRKAMYYRISRILNQRHMKTNIRERLLTAAVFFTGISVMILLNGFSSGISFVKQQQQPLISSAIDTVPVVQEPAEHEENQEFDIDINVDIDQEIEAEIDKNLDIQIDREVKEALEKIDWESMKHEIEASMKDIDWEGMKMEIEASMKDIDWEGMKMEIEASMKEIDWDQIQMDVQKSMKEIDWEGMKRDIETSMKEIDWDKIREDLEGVKERMDSIR